MNKAGDDLKREIGVIGLSANLINTIVGAGIFTLPAIVAAGLGASSIYAYLFCGFLVTLVMLCFAEVGSKITSSGGPYTYIKSTFGSFPGFITLILFILSTISADAAVANAIADIISSLAPGLNTKIFRIPFFFILFAGLGYINIKGVKEGIGLVKIITVTKLIPLLLIVFFSWGKVSIDHFAIDTHPSLIEIGKMSLILFFAFQGAESGLSISGEVKHPNKTIPKAILISIASVLVLYILIQMVSQGVLGDSLSTFKENPLSEVANQVFGPIGFTIITIGAAVSMFGYLSSEILSIPRAIFQASKDNVLPVSSFAKVHPVFQTPYISIIIYASAGFLLATMGGFEQLAIISSAAMLLVYLGVSLAVLKLRRENKDQKRNNSEFNIPGGYIVPALATLIIIWLLSNLAPHEFIIISTLIIVLTLLYFIKTKFGK